MLHFNNAPSLFRRAGLAIFLLQLCVFVFGLPMFRSGLWPRSEPILLAIFLSSALLCFWFWLGIAKSWLAVERSNNPLFLCMVLWVGWQWVVTLFATSSWRSWFGVPGFGEGAAWYSCMLLAAMLAHALWQHMPCRHAMLRTCGLAIAVLSVLYGLGPAQEFYILLFDPWRPTLWTEPLAFWLPNRWGDYLVFMLGWAWIAFLLARPSVSLRIYGALAAASLLVLLGANSRAGIFLMPYALTLTGVTLWCEKRGLALFGAPGKTWRALACLACFLPLAWVAFGLVNTQAEGQTSLAIRTRMNQIALSTLAHEPSRLVMGDGWVRFADDGMKYAMAAGGRHFKNGKNDPEAQFIYENSFHTHNQPVEALLSLGLPGMLLWFAIPLLAIWRLPQDRFWRTAPMLAAITVLSGFWFPIAQILTFQALGWAVLCHATARQPLEKRSFPPSLCLAAIPVAMLFLWSSGQQYMAMRYGTVLSEAFSRPYQEYSPHWLADDARRGGDRLRGGANYLLENLRLGTVAITPNIVGWYGNYMDAAAIMAQKPGIGAYNGSLELTMQIFLMANLSDQAFAPIEAKSEPFFPASVVRLAAQAPLREDLSALYLYRLKNEGDTTILPALLQRLLLIHPDHRVALWLMGKEMLKHPEHVMQGKIMMRRAAALGVDRIYPIPDAELAPFLEEE